MTSRTHRTIPRAVAAYSSVPNRANASAYALSSSELSYDIFSKCGTIHSASTL